MARVALAAAFLHGACQAADIPDAFLGSWKALSGVQAILGPAGVPTFEMSKDETLHRGDYWFSVIPGQVFRIRENKMQYCFAHVATSPFVVDTVEDNIIRFCYATGERMPTHKVLDNGTLATGCDASKIELELHENGNLEFSFWMSPPVRHAWGLYKRVGPGPPIAFYLSVNVGGSCDPLHPGPPTLGGQPDTSMCPVLHQKKQHLQQLQLAMPTMEHNETQEDDIQKYEDGEGEGAAWKKATCRRYDSGWSSWALNNEEKVDVQLKYIVPGGLRCWPCNVSYSVSAAIAEDEYIALGFKGMGYRALSHHKDLLRPNYFGMSADEVDDERTTRAIVLGYAGGSAGSCVREMKAEGYVGDVSDVPGNPDLTDALVQRLNGRTIISFTIEQHVGKTSLAIHNFFNTEQISARTMWAIGGLKGVDCEAEPQFHRARGLSPLSWFNANLKHKCLKEDEAEFGVRVEGNEMSV